MAHIMNAAIPLWEAAVLVIVLIVVVVLTLAYMGGNKAGWS
jgi:hypothetical protein